MGEGGAARGDWWNEVRFLLLLHLHGDRSATLSMPRCKAWLLAEELCRSLHGIRGQRWPITSTSLSPPTYRSTSAIRTPLAARFEREHERPLTPISAKGNGPLDSQCSRSPSHPTQPQRKTPQDPRLYDTIREVHRTRCTHRLSPPSHWPRSSKFSLSSSSSEAAGRCSARPRGIGLCPPDPLSEGLDDRQLRRDPLDGFPLRGVLALVIEDHPHGPFPDLRRIGTTSRFALLWHCSDIRREEAVNGGWEGAV